MWWEGRKGGDSSWNHRLSPRERVLKSSCFHEQRMSSGKSAEVCLWASVSSSFSGESYTSCPLHSLVVLRTSVRLACTSLDENEWTDI